MSSISSGNMMLRYCSSQIEAAVQESEVGPTDIGVRDPIEESRVNHEDEVHETEGYEHRSDLDDLKKHHTESTEVNVLYPPMDSK